MEEHVNGSGSGQDVEIKTSPAERKEMGSSFSAGESLEGFEVETFDDFEQWAKTIEDNEDLLNSWIDKTWNLKPREVQAIKKLIAKRTGVGVQALGAERLEIKKERLKLERIKKASDKIQRLEADGREKIFYDVSFEFKAVEQISKIVSSHQPALAYRYANQLVSVMLKRPKSVRAMLKLGGGQYEEMPLIHSHSKTTALHIVEHLCFMTSEGKDGETTFIKIPDSIITGWLETPISHESNLIGVVEHPYINLNDQPETRQGYDKNTGLYHQYSDRILETIGFLDGDLTLDGVKKAYKYLLDEVFEGFPFETEIDAALAISVFLTALQRKMFIHDSGSPGYLITAPMQGTGKTALIQLISYAVYGRPVAASSWSDDDTEFGKRLLSILMEGHSMILFDNIKEGSQIESDELAKAMTSLEYSNRLLGKSKTVTVPSNALWMFTGNNVVPCGDFNTRILVIRMDAKKADPDSRKFKRKNIGKWAIENRIKIIKSVMQIILYSRKQPEPDLTPSRFSDWDKWSRYPVYHASGIDIAEAFKQNKENDPKLEGQKNFLQAWFEAFGSYGKTAKEILTYAKGTLSENDISEALQDIFGGQLPTSRQLGSWLGKIRGRIIGGYRIIKGGIGTDRETHKKIIWKVKLHKE